MITVIRPDGFELLEWTDYVGSELSQFGLAPRLSDETRWREDWAAPIIGLPGVAAFQPPDPYAFTSWREWADSFNKALG